MRTKTSFSLLAALVVAGCADAPSAPPSAAVAPVDADADLLNGLIIVTAGHGQYAIAGTVADFSFSAVQVGRTFPRSTGKFRHSVTVGGTLVEFEGKVTCLAIDESNGRAWIAGTVTKNNSTNPGFTTPIHEVGRDIWFRVVDYGVGQQQSQPDRTTFVGFEGGAGIITSAEYCASRPWPDNDERTNPVTTGNILVL
jgi:hypothetical protein